MRGNFTTQLETIKEKTGVHLDSSRIVDQALCFKNEHFLPKKRKKPILYKNVNTFFNVFPITKYENTLLVDDTPYKSLFHLLFNVFFLEMFSRS